MSAAGVKASTNIFMNSEALGCIGVFIAMLLVDRVPRKTLISLLFIMKVLFTAVLLRDPPEEGSSLPFAVLPFTMVVSAALWPAVSIYVSEAFPTEVRSTGTGVAFVFGRVLSLLLPSLAGLVIRDNYK